MTDAQAQLIISLLQSINKDLVRIIRLMEFLVGEKGKKHEPE